MEFKLIQGCGLGGQLILGLGYSELALYSALPRHLLRLCTGVDGFSSHTRRILSDISTLTMLTRYIVINRTSEAFIPSVEPAKYSQTT